MDIFAFVLAIGALIWAYRNRSALDELKDTTNYLQSEIDTLRRRIEKLTTPVEIPAPKPVEPVPPRAIVVPPPPPLPPPVVVPPAPAIPPPPPPKAAIPPPPPPTPKPAPIFIPPPPPAPPFDWESLIGVKLFSWIAGIALVFAGVFFLKYSVERGYLGPPVRFAIGLLVGAGLLVVCEWKAARRYSVTANALDAAGIAILFSTFFAAHSLWNLIPAVATFALMAMVTAVAVLLSIRHDSVFIALLGLVGGFATPVLLSTGEDRPVALFSYLLLLNAGLAWVAYKKRWPHLTLLSAIFTGIYQWGWVVKFLRTGNLPLALGIFAVFPVLSFVALALGEKKKDPDDSRSVLFQRTSAVSVFMPLAFAAYMAIVPAYGANYWMLFGFLFLVDLGLAAIAAKRGPEWLHLGAAAATLLVFVAWLSESYKSNSWPAVLGITAVFVLFFIAVPYVLKRFGLEFSSDATLADFAAPLLLVVFPVLAMIEPATAAPGLLFGVLFLLMAAIAAHAISQENGPLHFLAAFFTLAAEAVWSAHHLTPGRLLPALAIYAVFGLFYLGVPLLAGRWNKTLRPQGSGAILVFVSLGLLFFLAAGPVAASALWGIGLLLLILNAGLFFEAASGRHPLILLAGLVLSWIVILVWWTTVSLAALLLPGLITVGGFAIVILGGNIWAARRAETESSAFDKGLYLALVGHGFLLFVVMQKPLALPPWPFLGVMAVLDLAIGVAALYARRGELHVGALAASQVILIVWQYTTVQSPWPDYALYCALALGVMGIAWYGLARRLKIADMLFAAASVAASVLGMGVLLFGTALPGSPGVASLTIGYVILLCFLLTIAWFAEWMPLAPAAVLPTAIGVAVWHNEHFKPELWKHEFFMALAIYAIFLLYPFVIGRRAGKLIEPYLAAVLASVPFFLAARKSLMVGGFADEIGLLPVMQAAAMAVLLWRLLQLEPPGERTLGRLALMAAAVLAFITVAIPLQLEKQWITIGWALLAAALAWLVRRIPHPGLVGWAGGLLAAVFARLVFNPAVFEYHPRGAMPIWNWYLYTYLISATAFFVTAWLLRDQEELIDNPFGQLTRLASPGGTVLLFLLLNIEIADYYSKGSALTFNFSAGIAQNLTYTIAWGLFAFALLITGIMLHSKPGRISAIALLSVTIAKCFLYDLWSLGGLYRVGSLVGLAICLTLVALLLQKFVLQPQKESE